MGACQSQAAATGGVVVAAANPTANINKGIPGAISGNQSDVETPLRVGKQPPGIKGGSTKNKVPAYELALMPSPSERTNATQAMTPMSSSGDYQDDPSAATSEDGNLSQLDVPFDEEMGENGDDGVPSDEEGINKDDAASVGSDRSFAATCPDNMYSTPGHGKTSTPRSFVAPMGMTSSSTPSSKKKRLGLFARSTKKTPKTPMLSEEPTPEKEELESVDEPKEVIESVIVSPVLRVSVNNTTPLVAPPKGVDVEFDSPDDPSLQLAVNPRTLANFNKMKIQAQQAESLEQKKKVQEKVKDRRKDIQGYNELWDEFSAIEEKVSQQQDNETINSDYVAATELPISIQDTSSWFVDFSSLNGDALTLSSGEEHFEEDDDAKSQSSFSLHSEMSERAQRELFKAKARKRRMSSVAARVLGGENDQNGCRQTMNLNRDNNDSISEFSSDNGSVSAAERNDDYGVLQKFRLKSIEQSVMDYAEYFAEETPLPPQSAMSNNDSALKAIHFVDPSILEEVQGPQNVYPDAPTPKTVNSRSASIESYLEEMSLPSVSIENAETGVVRWREFPKSEERAKTARKLEFQADETQVRIDMQEEIDEGRASRDEAEATNKLPVKKPKIKTYHPVIASMSTEDFYRAANARGTIPIFKDLPVEASSASTLSSTKTYRSNNSRKNNALPSSIVADDGIADPTSNNKTELKANRELLARKVGTKLAGLVAQLKENGLGE